MKETEGLSALARLILKADEWPIPLGVVAKDKAEKDMLAACQELGAVVLFRGRRAYGKVDMVDGPRSYALTPDNPARPSDLRRGPERSASDTVFATKPFWINSDELGKTHYKPPHGTKWAITIKDSRTHAEDEALLARVKQVLAMDNKSISGACIPGICSQESAGAKIREILTPEGVE